MTVGEKTPGILELARTALATDKFGSLRISDSAVIIFVAKINNFDFP